MDMDPLYQIRYPLGDVHIRIHWPIPVSSISTEALSWGIVRIDCIIGDWCIWWIGEFEIAMFGIGSFVDWCFVLYCGCNW